MSAKLESDLTCIQCGYNLRTLFVDGRCPECGTLVDRSLKGNLLRYADPHWLDKLRLGTAMLLGSVCVLLLGSCLFGAVFRMIDGATATILISLIFSAVTLTAMLLITAREPAIAASEDPITLRRVVRACASLLFAGQAILILSHFVRWGDLMLRLTMLGMLVVAGIAYFVTFTYFRRLALRIPDDKLARMTTVVMWGFFGLWVMLIGWGILAAASALVRTSEAFQAVSAASICGGLVAGLVLCILALGGMMSYYYHFTQAALEARSSPGIARHCFDTQDVAASE